MVKWLIFNARAISYWSVQKMKPFFCMFFFRFFLCYQQIGVAIISTARGIHFLEIENATQFNVMLHRKVITLLFKYDIILVLLLPRTLNIARHLILAIFWFFFSVFYVSTVFFHFLFSFDKNGSQLQSPPTWLIKLIRIANMKSNIVCKRKPVPVVVVIFFYVKCFFSFFVSLCCRWRVSFPCHCALSVWRLPPLIVKVTHNFRCVV